MEKINNQLILVKKKKDKILILNIKINWQKAIVIV